MRKRLSRRDFSMLAAAGCALPAAAADPLPTRPLGKIGFQASMLGFGAQRIADLATPMEQSAVDRLVGEALDSGMNYFDTARGYGASEELLGPALKGRRDKVFLVSKTRSATREAALNDVRESLRRLRTDHLDCVHIHNISVETRFPDIDVALSEKGVLGGLMEAKKQGMVRRIGCTTHTNTDRVLKAFGTGEIEVFMAVLNFVERNTYDFEAKIFPEARRRGIPVIAMKVLGGPVNGPGARLTSPEDYSNSFRYVWGIPALAVAIVGFRNPNELRQAIAQAKSFKPLSKGELAALEGRGKQMAAQWGPLRGPVVG